MAPETATTATHSESENDMANNHRSATLQPQDNEKDTQLGFNGMEMISPEAITQTHNIGTDEFNDMPKNSQGATTCQHQNDEKDTCLGYTGVSKRNDQDQASEVEQPLDFVDAPPSLVPKSLNTEQANSSKNNDEITVGACAAVTKQQISLNPFLDDAPEIEDIQPCLDIDDIDKFQWKTIGAEDQDSIDGSLFLHSNKDGGPNFYLTCMRWQRKDFEGILTRQISYRPKSFESCPMKRLPSSSPVGIFYFGN